MDYNKPKKEEDKTWSEPRAAHGPWAGKKVRIFNSFREQEDEMIQYWASITPAQRLAHLYEMVKISFRITEEEARRTHPSRKV